MENIEGTPELRCLVHCLLGKKWRKKPTPPELMLMEAMGKVAELASHLIANKEKIHVALIHVTQKTRRDMLENGGKKRTAALIADMNDSPDFASDVNTFHDIPHIYFISWARGVSKTDIDDELVKRLLKKSNKELNNGMTLCTGLAQMHSHGRFQAQAMVDTICRSIYVHVSI